MIKACVLRMGGAAVGLVVQRAGAAKQSPVNVCNQPDAFAQKSAALGRP